ncbi:MAG: helix-turn-helix domain-containing protein [bacterium]
MDDRWFSVEDIAAYLGVKKDTIYKWVRLKAMPAHKVGRLVKFKVTEVDQWIRSGKARQQ